MSSSVKPRIRYDSGEQKKSHIGERLRDERISLKLTQVDLATALGVSRRSVIDWEKGVATPNAEVLAALADLGCDVLYVLVGIRSIGQPASNDLRLQEPLAPGRDLMHQVRAGLLLQNTTLADWCRKREVNASAVRQAIYGTWAGPKGRAMRTEVLKAAGVRGAE